MTRNLKALGLALFALMAMGAMTAVSASAQEGEIFETSNSYPVHLQGGPVTPTPGEPTSGFTTSVGTLECASAAITANISAATKRLTVTPSYAGCTTAGKQPQTFTMNGCDYELHHATAGFTSDQWTVTADLKCTDTNKVKIHGYSNPANHTSGASNYSARMVPARRLRHIA